MATDAELATKVDKIQPIYGGEFKDPVITVNEQGQVIEAREKITEVASSFQQVTNNTSNFLQYLSFQVTLPQESSIWIELAANVNSTPDVAFIIDLLIDGASIFDGTFESIDGIKNLVTNDRLIELAKMVGPYTAGSHTISFVFKPELVGESIIMNSATIKVGES